MNVGHWAQMILWSRELILEPKQIGLSALPEWIAPHDARAAELLAEARRAYFALADYLAARREGKRDEQA